MWIVWIRACGRTRNCREEKERWIRAKYLEKEFLKSLPRTVPQRTSLTYLVEGIESGDVARVLLALAHGANVDVSVVEGRTPVHLAVARGNTAIVQLTLMVSPVSNRIESSGVESCRVESSK